MSYDSRSDNCGPRKPDEESKINEHVAKNALPKQGNSHVVATHYNALPETGLAVRNQSNIVYMRNFNNWIKSMLITEYLQRIRDVPSKRNAPINVLDVCCGKGGDLIKWSKGNISHLICTDIARVSVDQCKERYNSLRGNYNNKKFSAEFFDCDATMDCLRDHYENKDIKLNLVSCQFAFHYSFESVRQADCMVRNVSECLEEGGYFIATIPDANEIMRRLHLSADKRSFGNTLYNISFECETQPPPLFGAKYQFHLSDVVDCPEFLVHFGTLEALCRRYGLQLHRRTSFSDYFHEKLNAGRKLLQMMRAVETVRPESITDNIEYEHVKKHIQTNSFGSNVVGTISKSEWDVITLYSVYAFRKVKSSLDPEGNPIYHFDDDNATNK